MRLFLAAATLVVALPLPAQQDPGFRARAVVRPTLPYHYDAAAQVPDRVVLKIREGVVARLRDGQLRAQPTDGVDALRAVLGAVRIDRLFTRPVAELDQERSDLQKRMPANESPLADLNNYYRLTTSGVAETERLVNALNRLPIVETAYAEPLPVPIDDIPPPTPNFVGQQGHLGAAPAAFGYDAVQHIVGARFPDHDMAHLEGGWILGHEDCDWLATTSFVGSPPSGTYNSSTWTQHGTACVGLMVAGRNGYGTLGFASDCHKFYLCSLTNGGANMVSLVTALLAPGDVMSSSFAYVTGSYQAPRDWPQADFDAVRMAAAKGIHYTFGAGNTGHDLEDSTVFGGRYLPTAQSSGGYIIGMTDPGASGRRSDSNYSANHVIANGWGSSVTTLGYGDLFNGNNDPRQFYTSNFGGTSAAGPQVAGVIAAYVGIVEEQTGVVLTVSQVQADLRATGTPVSGSIGNRPDLNQLLALHGLPDGLLIHSDGTPGGSFTGEVQGGAGQAYAVVIAAARGRVVIGANRPLLIDPNGMVPLLGGTVGAGGTTPFTIPVPAIASLSGNDFYLQAAAVQGSTLHLSNSATTQIQ